MLQISPAYLFSDAKGVLLWTQLVSESHLPCFFSAPFCPVSSQCVRPLDPSPFCTDFVACAGCLGHTFSPVRKRDFFLPPLLWLPYPDRVEFLLRLSVKSGRVWDL